MLLSDAVSPESPCRYIFRVYLAPVVTYSAYISEGRDYADRFRLSPPIRSLVENPSVKSWRETNVARKKKQEGKKEGKNGERGEKDIAAFPTCFVSLHAVLYREASSFRSFLLVSFLPTQRFPAADTTGLLILIIDRGIIKVALVRGRFQLRISVSLGTIGLVDRRRE